MRFKDCEHEKFYNEKLLKLNNLKKDNVYYKSLIYTLSVCETTRKHFNEIFNIEKDEVNIDSIQKEWQTSTSRKVTRLAFNLWNDMLIYDSENDLENEKISTLYSPSDIFSCEYAPYLWEAIQIRYPEYASYDINNDEIEINKD